MPREAATERWGPGCSYTSSSTASSPCERQPVSGRWTLDKTTAIRRHGGSWCTRCTVTVRRGFSDRKSTRLNSSHGYISYAVFCLKKKKQKNRRQLTETVNDM